MIELLKYKGSSFGRCDLQQHTQDFTIDRYLMSIPYADVPLYKYCVDRGDSYGVYIYERDYTRETNESLYDNPYVAVIKINQYRTQCIFIKEYVSLMGFLQQYLHIFTLAITSFREVK